MSEASCIKKVLYISLANSDWGGINASHYITTIPLKYLSVWHHHRPPFRALWTPSCSSEPQDRSQTTSSVLDPLHWKHRNTLTVLYYCHVYHKNTHLLAQGCNPFQGSGCTVYVIIICSTLGTQTNSFCLFYDKIKHLD